MREFYILFVCLACVSRGQHARLLKKSSPITDVQEPSRSADGIEQSVTSASQASTQVGLEDKPSAWQSFANLLLGLNQAGGIPNSANRHSRGVSMNTLIPSQHPDIVPYQTSAYTPDNPEWLLEKSLGTKLRILGPRHPVALSSMHDYAMQVKAKGDLEKARGRMSEVVALRSIAAGDAHPSTLESKHELGLMLQRLGDLGGAEDVQREVVAAREDELKKAIAYLEAVKSGKDRVYQATRDSLEAKDKLAQTLQHTGDRVDLAEAEELQREVLEGKINLLGYENPEVIEIKTNLAKTLREIGNREEAEELEKQASSATMRLSYMQTGKSHSDLEVIKQTYSAETEEELAEKATQTPSHLQIDFDNDEEELKKGPYMFVEESKCVGCTWCAYVAPNTFFMEPETQRARAYTQGREDPDVLTEAVDCCPSNCIYLVDLDDLVVMETEREAEGPVSDYEAVLKGMTSTYGGKQHVGEARYSRDAGRGGTGFHGSRDFKGGFLKLDQDYAARQKRKARRHLKLKAPEDKEAAAREKRLDKFFNLLSEKVDTERQTQSAR
mmetsp:Transcript_118687/g.221847  ORF Transcript_118687/g.221847 Transcript_118687/m.221847 type:complete len:555 (+) Transcript_118687:56-1720(+)